MSRSRSPTSSASFVRSRATSRRRSLNDGGYDYVVIDPDQRTQGIKPAEAFWTMSDPAATQVLSDDLTFVFKLDGELDASTCTRFADVGGDAEVVTGGKTGLLQPSQ